MIRAPRPTEDAVQLGDAEFKLKGGEVEHPANRSWGSADLETNPLKSPALRAAMDDAVRENVDLIKRLPERVYRDLRRKLSAAVGRGLQVTQLQEVVRAELKSANPRSAMAAMMRRARLIARDQVGKFHGKLDETRQQESGVTHYRWRTVRDERVRGGPKYPHAHPDHAHREGQIFAWAKPPHEDDTDGHPGRPIQCRCYAEPVLGAPGVEYESGLPDAVLSILRKLGLRSATPPRPDKAASNLATAVSKLVLVGGQPAKVGAKEVRTAMRSFWSARGITSRATGLSGIDVLRINRETQSAGLFNAATAEVEITPSVFENLSSKDPVLRAQSFGVLIHEAGHEASPCGIRFVGGKWEDPYDASGIVIEEATNELLSHKWTNRYYGPSVRVYKEYIGSLRDSLVRAGLARNKSRANRIMFRAALIYKNSEGMVFSEDGMVRRWQESVEIAVKSPLTENQKDELWWGALRVAPTPRWLQNKDKEKHVSDDKQSEDDDSQLAKAMARALEEAKENVLWLKSRGELHVMHLHGHSRFLGGAFTEWVHSEGITPDIELEGGLKPI